MESTSNLDPEEYLQIAIAAINRNDHRAALSCLKEGAATHPNHPKLLYLLGAEYAQVGMFDRAESLMANAIEIDPQLHVARFQLGLLYMTSGLAEQAAAVWRGLDTLPSPHALKSFRDGLLALAADKFDIALANLQEGMAANNFSDVLNRDMMGVINRIRATTVAPPVDANDESGHILLHAYRNRDE